MAERSVMAGHELAINGYTRKLKPGPWLVRVDSGMGPRLCGIRLHSNAAWTFASLLGAEIFAGLVVSNCMSWWSRTVWSRMADRQTTSCARGHSLLVRVDVHGISLSGTCWRSPAAGVHFYSRLEPSLAGSCFLVFCYSLLLHARS